MIRAPGRGWGWRCAVWVTGCARPGPVRRRCVRSATPARPPRMSWCWMGCCRGWTALRSAGGPRRGSGIAVIMVTARGEDLDILGGLEAGADDYVVKPVEPRVLDARIRAVLRRGARAGCPAETYGELMIDRGALIVRRAGRDVVLAPAERRL